MNHFLFLKRVTKCNLLIHNYFVMLIWFEYLHCKSNVIGVRGYEYKMLYVCNTMYEYNLCAYWTRLSIKYEPVLIVSVWEQNCN